MSDSAEKLARTRLAIVEHVHRREGRRRPPQTQADVVALDNGQVLPASAQVMDETTNVQEWLRHASRAVSAWWRYHPAHLALDLATPSMSRYARHKPLQFLGIAAAAGALFMFARPWKLISATGILVALLKSTQISTLLMGAMSSSRNPRNDPPV